MYDIFYILTYLSLDIDLLAFRNLTLFLVSSSHPDEVGRLRDGTAFLFSTRLFKLLMPAKKSKM